MNEFDPNNLPADASFLSGPEPEFNEKQYDQATGGMVTAHNGVADRLLKNDRLYNAMKGDWKRTDWSNNGNMRITTGREDGKFYIQREQQNVPEVVERCAKYRAAAEAGWADMLAPIMPDGKLGYRWIDLPKVIERQIVDDYFGGMPWAVIKRDRTLKAQFYRVVQQEYPAFVCYPNGRLPIPIEVPYPNKVGQEKFFRGITQ
jgi:hypothetical protein